MVVKLIVRDVEYDSLTVLVRGDNSGDGYVTSVDVNKLKDHIRNVPDNIFDMLIDDVSGDGYITSVDLNRFKNYIMNKNNSLN